MYEYDKQQESGIIPRFAACQSQGIPWFETRGLWQDSGYVPSPGDIIFFDWAGRHSDHVGNPDFENRKREFEQEDTPNG